MLQNVSFLTFITLQTLLQNATTPLTLILTQLRGSLTTLVCL